MAIERTSWSMDETRLSWEASQWGGGIYPPRPIFIKFFNKCVFYEKLAASPLASRGLGPERFDKIKFSYFRFKIRM